jgi:hypothetical protein
VLLAVGSGAAALLLRPTIPYHPLAIGKWRRASRDRGCNPHSKCSKCCGCTEDQTRCAIASARSFAGLLMRTPGCIWIVPDAGDRAEWPVGLTMLVGVVHSKNFGPFRFTDGD